MIGFKEFLGNEQIKDHFRQAIQSKKVSHAYILAGEAGMGKKTLARAFAMALQCRKEDFEPCNECHSCKQFLTNNHPDVIYVSHEKPGSIGVDDVRQQINRDIVIKPYSGPYKIYIMDEAEKMTVQAQNALLKTIEEPPSYGIILLLTTNAEAFLPTILSRCILLKLTPLYDGKVWDYLVDTIGVQKETADICTALARGNLGKAIRLSSSPEFAEMKESVLHFLQYLKEMDISELLGFIKKMNEQKKDSNEYLDFIQIWYRDVLMLKVTNDINLLIFKDQYQILNKIAQTSSFQGLEHIIGAIDKAKIRLEANVNFELAIELMLLVMKEN